MKVLKRFLRSKIFLIAECSIIKFISKTVKIKCINREVVEDCLKKGKKIAFAFWHGRHFLLIDWHRNFNIVLMISLSKDGDLQTCILERFGYKCIRGSSAKGGVAALKGIVRMMNKNNYNTAIAVDGPRGPLYEPKEGIVLIARLTSSVIIPVATSAKPAKIFEKAWDKYLLPFPFSKAAIVYGNPIFVSKDDDISLKAVEIKKELDRITELADNLCGR
ncbi:MAG: lysophospholipid acyltransferase family protein [Elusimicrobiota bacterium]